MARYKPLPGARLPGIFRDLRRRAGYSRPQFAARTGVTEWTIQAVEKGTQPPSQDLLNFYGELARVDK